MMDFIFTFRGMESSNAIKQYAEKKFRRFEKYFIGPVEVQIVFKREKFREIVEVVITGDGQKIIAKEETSDIYEAIDLVHDSVEKQIKKIKEKRKGFRKSRESQMSIEIPEDKYLIKTMEINPLSTQEAIEWFEKNKDTFMLFYNTDYDKICLIYKEGDKPVLIIPEFS
ncbi:MAG: ribosome-associated translation inhibitor RaiA [Thermodesulfobacteriota bacterium]|nr:MAG: ribosome-associated translation inhibitor RaiA [Thermodesulfobacteriota bacterium]